MANISRLTPRYSWSDHLFLTWMEQTDWPPNFKRVLRLLFEHQRKHGRVFLFYKTIATWLHISVKTVQRAVRFFANLGPVEVQHRRTQAGDLGANYFKVIPHILALSPAANVATCGQSVATPPVPDTSTPQASPPIPDPVDNGNNKEFFNKKINNLPLASSSAAGSPPTVVVPPVPSFSQIPPP